MTKKIQLTMSDFDTKTRPQDDFFQFAAGGWIKRNPIPETEGIWSRFRMLRQRTLKQLHDIFKDIEKRKNLPKGSEAQQIRDFYISGMDMKTRNKLGLSPIEKHLEAIENIKTHEDVMNFIFNDHKNAGDLLWGHYVGTDDKNNEQYIFHLFQGSLSLPDRDYYLKNDTRSNKVREFFVSYIEKLLILSGVGKREAKKDAETILSLETRLARMMMNRTDSRDIDKVYNKLTVAELKKVAPDIPWNEYLRNLKVDTKVKKILVLQPTYLAKLGILMKKTPVSTWKSFFYFSIINDAAPALSKPYIDLAFSFYGTVLSGTVKMQPLWKRVVQTIDMYIGEAVGKEYVKRHFPPEAKEKINDMVNDILAAYKRRMQEIKWMTPQTKKRALKKLENTGRKLGYPDKWRSYKGLVIKPDTYFENIERAERFEHKKNLARLGKKVDKSRWYMTPQTVNAYCNLNGNEVVFPAAILQPPFFDPEGDDAMNYGCMGAVIGHELTHNFDDQGSKFDEKGNYKKWWTEKDEKQFKKRAQVLVRQYNTFKVDELFVNGNLTLGENIADLGGLEIALDAFKMHMQKVPQKTIKGFTPIQRYFLGLVLFEAEHARKELAHMRVMTDPHSPSKYRVNGPFPNINEFYEAWDVKPGDKLYRTPKDRAKIW